MDTLLTALAGLETATADITDCAEQLSCENSDLLASETVDARVAKLRSSYAEFKSAKLPFTAPEQAAAVWRLACQLWVRFKSSTC